MVILASGTEETCTIMAEPRQQRQCENLSHHADTVSRLCPFSCSKVVVSVVLAFLLRGLVPPDLLLPGYGRSWTEAEGRSDGSDMCPVKSEGI